MDFLSSVLPFVGSLASGVMKIFGGESAQKSQEAIANENLAQQVSFAQHGLQWRAADATQAEKDTGINRLALLGVPTTSYSNQVGSTALGDSIGAAGQDVGRAVAALAPVKLRNAELENKLLEAKIRNFDADTVGRMKEASDAVKTLGQPGTGPGIPLPRSDPRGPVINLVQRYFDPRTGEYGWIPSEKAASPLQTLGALPVNAALAGRGASEGLLGLDSPSDRGFSELTGAVQRATSSSQFEPYYNSPAPY